MSTYCSTYGGNGFSFWKLLFLLAAIGSAVALGIHATKHSLADVVRNCPEENIKLVLRNPTTGRLAKVCQPDLNQDQFGRMITEFQDFIEKEVTSFMNSEYRKNTLRKVVLNLSNQGYTEIIHIAPEIKDAIIIILSTP